MSSIRVEPRFSSRDLISRTVPPMPARAARGCSIRWVRTRSRVSISLATVGWGSWGRIMSSSRIQSP
jgi:hypothetical protein